MNSNNAPYLYMLYPFFLKSARHKNRLTSLQKIIIEGNTHI